METHSLGAGRKNISGYHLLTGATGLLGSYLLRDSLLAGRRMAVLVRPSKSESAVQRIETPVAAMGTVDADLHGQARCRDR